MPRVRKISFLDQFNSTIIMELIKNKNVLISAEYIINEIIKFYYTINLKESGDISTTNLYGFPIRKLIDQSLRRRLENL